MRGNSIHVELKRLDGSPVPEYATQGSAGFDLMAAEQTVIQPGQTALVPTGICVAVPDGFEIQIRPRSGISLKTGLRVANSPGTIDSDFRGEIKVIMHNGDNWVRTIGKGEKIAQGVLCPYFVALWREVLELEETERGEGGFGSTDNLKN